MSHMYQYESRPTQCRGSRLLEKQRMTLTHSTQHTSLDRSDGGNSILFTSPVIIVRAVFTHQCNEMLTQHCIKSPIAGLVFLCLLLLLVFGGILVLFMCYIRRGRLGIKNNLNYNSIYSIEYRNDGYLSIAGTRCGTWCLIIVLCRRLREKARLRNASTHGSINNGYVNPSYNHVNECTNINPQQPASSNGVGPEKTPRPSPLDMFAAAGRGIRSPDGVTMYNERCVDGASAGTAEKEQQAMEISARGKDGPASKYKVEHEVSTVRSEGEAVLVGTRSYGDPSPSQSADVSQHSSRGHRSDDSFHSRTYELPPTDGDRDDDKRKKRHSRSRGNPHGDGSMRRPRDRSRSRNREKQFGSHDSLRNIDDVRPRSVKRHVRSHSVDDNLDGNFDEFTNPPLKEKDRKMSVGHGSMMSLRHLDDLYGDDDAFAVVDVSSNRRKSLVIGSQASLQVAAADGCVEYDSDAEKRRKEKRRLKKEKQRQKRMNASLPSLRGFNLEASENDRYLATDRSHGSSRRYDPEDPRHSDRSERGTSDLTRTPRSSRRGEVERPGSGRRASVGKLDPIGTPRSSRRNYHRDQEDGGRPPHHDVRSLRTRSNSLSSNPLKDNQSSSSRGYGNFFEDDQHESHQRRRHRVKDRRASDSSRASLRDRDFESDGTEEQDHRVSRRDSRKQSRNSFRRSASHDGTLDNSRDDRRPKSAKGRNSKSNDDTSALRRSGSKRMLIRNSSQDSFSSGVGQDAQDDNFPPLVRRGSTASLIKVRPIPDHKLEPKLSAPPKEFDNKDGIPTVDILRLTSDSLSDAEKVTDHKDTMVDSGAWSTVKKATAEQSLDELVESYTRVATDEMAFEIASARNTGREENDMNIMSIDFSNEEVFEV